MPITPFHLIAGSSLKVIAPRYFSWVTFALTNILIDLEPITLYLITLNPGHEFFHTIVGATIIAILVATVGRRPCELLLDLWNNDLKGKERLWLSVNSNISKTSSWIGAITGAWTHLFLDSLMHDDIRPLWPFSDVNHLVGSIEISMLHTILSAVGIVGVLCLVIGRRFFTK